jgi:hypothetical protein
VQTVVPCINTDVEQTKQVIELYLHYGSNEVKFETGKTKMSRGNVILSGVNMKKSEKYWRRCDMTGA